MRLFIRKESNALKVFALVFFCSQIAWSIDPVASPALTSNQSGMGEKCQALMDRIYIETNQRLTDFLKQHNLVDRSFPNQSLAYKRVSWKTIFDQRSFYENVSRAYSNQLERDGIRGNPGFSFYIPYNEIVLKRVAKVLNQIVEHADQYEKADLGDFQGSKNPLDVILTDEEVFEFVKGYSGTGLQPNFNSQFYRAFTQRAIHLALQTDDPELSNTIITRLEDLLKRSPDRYQFTFSATTALSSRSDLMEILLSELLFDSDLRNSLGYFGLDRPQNLLSLIDAYEVVLEYGDSKLRARAEASIRKIISLLDPEDEILLHLEQLIDRER